MPIILTNDYRVKTVSDTEYLDHTFQKDDAKNFLVDDDKQFVPIIRTITQKRLQRLHALPCLSACDEDKDSNPTRRKASRNGKDKHDDHRPGTRQLSPEESDRLALLYFLQPCNAHALALLTALAVQEHGVLTIEQILASHVVPANTLTDSWRALQNYGCITYPKGASELVLMMTGERILRLVQEQQRQEREKGQRNTAREIFRKTWDEERIASIVDVAFRRALATDPSVRPCLEAEAKRTLEQCDPAMDAHAIEQVISSALAAVLQDVVPSSAETEPTVNDLTNDSIPL